MYASRLLVRGWERGSCSGESTIGCGWIKPQLPTALVPRLLQMKMMTVPAMKETEQPPW
jgi:hypothetical protein